MICHIVHFFSPQYVEVTSDAAADNCHMKNKEIWHLDYHLYLFKKLSRKCNFLTALPLILVKICMCVLIKNSIKCIR